MTNTATIQSIHVRDMKDFGVEFTQLRPTEEITVFRMGFGNNTFSIFFQTEEEARTFATEIWLAWADHMMKLVDAEAVTGA